MPINEIEVIRKQYSIAIDVDDMIHILKKEADIFREDEITLCEHLDAIPGVGTVMYNGHFGAYIYLMILTECDDEETWKLIKEQINKAIDRS